MRSNVLTTLNDISGYIGALLWVFGFIVLIPLTILPFFSPDPIVVSDLIPFLVPSALAVFFGFFLKRAFSFPQLSGREALLVVTLGWICTSLFGALPFTLALDVGFLDSFFESMSGFTTTGITMFSGLDSMPHTILFWRSFTEWIGGLGILTFFLLLVFRGGTAHQLFKAESHKVLSERPAPGMFSTLKILWSIYGLFTGLTVLVLVAEGVPIFDALNHAMTALSTGGFTPHDSSVDYFRQSEFANYRLIEWTLILSMVLGGTSFVVHYRILRGELSALWSSAEIRLWWKLIGGGFLLVVISHVAQYGLANLGEVSRYSLFQVVSIITTTGFATKSIADPFFPTLAKQVFLISMVIGGCVGSTSGGVKVLRIDVLGKMIKREFRKLVLPERAVTPLIVDGKELPGEEIRRISALFFAWVSLLVLGGMITALLSDLPAYAAFSGMFSALGNIGPTYIPHAKMMSLHPIIKLTYILGMLAGRLEILPVVLLFMKRAWR